MTSERQTKNSGKKIQISAVSAQDQMTRVQGAIARRAFLHRDARNPGHELESWRLAKAELLKPLCFGESIREDAIWIGIDTGKLQEGTIEVWVSPRHVTIFGKCCESPGAEATKESSQEQDKIVFHSIDMPVDVEPSAATAEFNGALLELCFPKARETATA